MNVSGRLQNVHSNERYKFDKIILTIVWVFDTLWIDCCCWQEIKQPVKIWRLLEKEGVMMQKRSILTCVILSIVTCGIYSLYWFVMLTEDANRLSGRQSPSGITALLLTIVTCGIYGLYWAYQMGETLYGARMQRGYMGSNNNVLYLVLEFVCYVAGYAVMQNEINQIIDADIANYGR